MMGCFQLSVIKIGILGGTFNPIHNAHLALAASAAEQLALNFVLFIPNAAPPHKEVADGVSITHRVNMVELAIANNPKFQLCMIEASPNEKNYTADTVEILSKRYPGGEFYYIAGSDALAEMNGWRDPHRIFANSRVAATVRATTPAAQSAAPPSEKGALSNVIENLKQTYNADITIITMPPEDISSTQVRQIVKSGGDITALVPDKVRDYILGEGLYV